MLLRPSGQAQEASSSMLWMPALMHSAGHLGLSLSLADISLRLFQSNDLHYIGSVASRTT
jgi:hypothetical protein